MTERRYQPEGMRMESADNRQFTGSLRGLEQAMAQNQILEGMASLCDCRTMALRVELGGVVGEIVREEAVYQHDGSAVKDIAVITRVGKPVCFKILSLESRNGIPYARLSRRAAQEECMKQSVLRFRPGDVIPACVTHLEPFGAFVDIGCGIVSLLSVDCISVSRIAHPSERFSVGDTVSAVVKSMDSVSGRVYMTHRELLGTWEENAAAFMPSQTVTGIVRSIEPYGIFVELAPNLTGLAEVREGVQIGDRCAVYIKSILPERMKIKLVIVDRCADGGVPPMRYYVDTDAVRHISYWRYSPASCTKCVETVFDAV